MWQENKLHQSWRKKSNLSKNGSLCSKIPINAKDELERASVVKKMKEQNVKAAYDYES